MGSKKLVKKSSISRLEALHEKMINKGISAARAKTFTAKEWKQHGLSKKLLPKDSLVGQKRWLNQINKHQLKVLKHGYKKRGITDNEYKKFLKQRTNALFGGRVVKDTKAQKPSSVYAIIMAGRFVLPGGGYSGWKQVTRYVDAENLAAEERKIPYGDYMKDKVEGKKFYVNDYIVKPVSNIIEGYDTRDYISDGESMAEA